MARRLLTQVLVVAGLLGVQSALAVDPERHISELAHRTWGSKDGAPAYTVGLAQTEDGYLWLASYSGLYRFDGTQFQLFAPFSGPKLPSREIASVFAPQDGALWIGYRNGGVSALRAGRLTNYRSADGFPEGRVTGFARDRQGRIWASSSGGLACFEGGRWRTVGKESSFPSLAAQAVLVDHLGTLWAAGDHRVAVLRPGATQFELTDEPYNGRVRQLAESPDGTVWMAETTRAVRPLLRPGQATDFHGLSRADCQSRFPDTWQTERQCQRPDELEVRVGSQSLLFDRDGALWITTLGDGLRRAPYPTRLRQEPIGEFSSVLEQFTNKDGLSADYVTYVFQDREGSVWVSTNTGIDQFRASVLAPIVFGSDAGGLSLAPGDDGDIFAEGGGRIVRLHNARDKPVLVDADAGTSTLQRDPFGSIWSAGTRGACRLVEHRCIDNVEFPAGKQIPWPGQWRFAVDERRRGWAYLEKDGLFRRENGQWSPVPEAPIGSEPFTQFTDPAGEIWFGLSSGQLVSVKNGHVRTYSSDDGLPLGTIKAIDSLGAHVWVGGEGGVSLLRGSRFTSVVPYDAAAFDSVSGVVEAADGSLWLTEYRGVIRIPATEVAHVLRNEAYRPRYEVLNQLDGLPGGTEQVRRLPAAIRGSDGRLWFSAAKGVAWVDPRKLYRNTLPPPVSIQGIVADGHVFAPWARVQLAGTTANLQIAYSGLSLAVPERVQFRYRLKGFDHEWQNVGTRRTAYYTRLPPGAYDFQVIAANDAGIWNDAGAELHILVIPAWYQTSWFRALCAVAAAGLLWGAYRVRLRQVAHTFERNLEARVAERTRIARDLHDTLLGSLNGVLLHLEAASLLFKDRPGEAKQTLDRTIAETAQAINEGRDAVQGLRSSITESNDLAEAIDQLGKELAGAQGQGAPDSADKVPHTTFVVEVEGARRALHPIVRDEVFRIATEALRNAFQHSRGTKIEVELHYDVRRFRLRIRDDGRGIDPQVLASGGRQGHFGLKGMRERAELLGGKLAVWSARGAGTELDVTIPGNRAYRGTPEQAPRRAADTPADVEAGGRWQDQPPRASP